MHNKISIRREEMTPFFYFGIWFCWGFDSDLVIQLGFVVAHGYKLLQSLNPNQARFVGVKVICHCCQLSTNIHKMKLEDYKFRNMKRVWVHHGCTSSSVKSISVLWSISRNSAGVTAWICEPSPLKRYCRNKSLALFTLVNKGVVFIHTL